MNVVLGKLNDELLINIASRAAPFCSQVDAAVAYAAGNDHPLIKSCKEKALRLTFYGLLDEDGAVSPALLKELLAWGPSRADVRLVKGNFHAKVIWWRGYGAYVGSANLTHKAWFNNVEAGVFFDEADLISSGAGAELDLMFDHLAGHSVPVTNEVVEKLEQLARDRQRLLAEQRSKIETKFSQLFGHLPDNQGLTVLPAKGHKENKALKRFATEWMQTLQLMRGLAKEFAALGLRPRWVDPDAHPAIHFDQFLHAYYYDFVRAPVEEDDDLSALGKVEEFYGRHHANPSKALLEGARWWATLAEDPHGEAEFIRSTAPGMRAHLSQESVRTMDLPAFREALRYVNAFRMHARQTRNAVFGLPSDHHETMDERVTRLCDWLWQQRSVGGHTVREVLEFVLWGTTPSDMEQRLWFAVWDPKYRLPHFGQSTLGEAVGWARPDNFPPRKQSNEQGAARPRARREALLELLAGEPALGDVVPARGVRDHDEHRPAYGTDGASRGASDAPRARRGSASGSLRRRFDLSSGSRVRRGAPGAQGQREPMGA